MRIRTGAITAATALALAVGLATPASAVPADTQKSDGSTVSATFVKKEAMTCASGTPGRRTITSTYDGDAFLTYGGKGDNYWSVEYDRSQIEVAVHDTCGGEDLAFGGDLDFRGGLPLFPKTAKTARVRASVDLYLPEGQWGDGDADLDFTANSRPIKSTERKREITVNGKTFTRSRTSVQSAGVTGSISVNGTGIDYLDGRNLTQGATLVEASMGTSTYTLKTRTRP